MRTLFLFTLIALISGCASGPPAVREKRVKFESDPPGARIFVAYGADERAARNRNWEFLGTTPCESPIACESNGHFKITTSVLGYSMVVSPVAVFTAEPPSNATNLYPRRLVFHSGASVLNAGDKVPNAMFFDLTKPDPAK